MTTIAIVEAFGSISIRFCPSTTLISVIPVALLLIETCDETGPDPIEAHHKHDRNGRGFCPNLEGWTNGCCTVEMVTFYAGSGGPPTSTNGIHRDMAGD